jgi:hypothetical protein
MLLMKILAPTGLLLPFLLLLLLLLLAASEAPNATRQTTTTTRRSGGPWGSVAGASPRWFVAEGLERECWNSW